MGRQTRQSRRTSGRRQETRQVHTPAKKTQPWQNVAGVVLVLAVAAVLAVLAFKPGSASGTDVTKAATQGEKTAGKVDGQIGCNAMEQITYHVHDQSAIVHIESPHKILPTLGTWYDVMKLPLSSTQIGSYKVESRQHLKIYVNGKPYSGNPRDIVLTQHKDIWLEIGPPFQKPTPFDFAANGV